MTGIHFARVVSAVFLASSEKRARPARTFVADKSLGKQALFISLLLLTLNVQSGQAAVGDALQFFKNYFITGDYVVGGVGLRGQGVTDPATQATAGSPLTSFATGTIHMSGVPQGADIVAAYVYWENITGTSVIPADLAFGTFRGNKIAGKLLVDLSAKPAILACWSSGGGNGTTKGATPLLVYRADVLRFLPFPKAANGQASSQRVVNDADLVSDGFALTTISLPDSGGGGGTSPSTSNQAFLTEGASLVVVYRIANDPLRAVIIYDGGYTFSSDIPTMTQTLQGFYEASKTSPVAKMTHIVGNGRNFQEKLYFNTTQLTPLNSSVPSATDPFPGSLGSAWDNLTVTVSPFMTGDDSMVTTSVTPGDPSSVACLSWGAIVFSTTLQDTDGDGLLDKWETEGLKDPTTGALLVDLPHMGADPNVRDIFIEIDDLGTNGYTTTPQGFVPAHSHKPTQGALDMVGDAFKNAPAACFGLPAVCKGINVHFDIGNNYQTSLADPAKPDSYIIPAAYSGGGGEVIGEKCATDTPASGFPTCAPGATQFPDYPGTLTWKSGFDFIKNGAPGSGLPAHFDHNRKDIFHYVLFGHTLALPKWSINDKSLTKIVATSTTATITTTSPSDTSLPATVTILGAAANSNLNGGSYTPAAVGGTTNFTFTVAARPGLPFAAGTYQNWGLAVSNGIPRSNSGASDLLGGDVLVTLGRWDNFKGTEYMNAATLMHELGHNLSLRHGGAPGEPNCKPNYQSIMSYLFQVLGLLDPSGVPHIGYSGKALPQLDEGSLSLIESQGLDTSPLPYEPRWFAPLSGSFLDGVVNTTPAAKHCDGTPLNRDANGNLTEPATVRIDGTSLPGKPIPGSPIDWNADADTLPDSMLSQDIDFNGTVDSINGFNDWANIDLRQTGSRHNSIGYSLDVGPSDDVAASDGAGNGLDLGSGNGLDLGSGNGADLGSGNGLDLGSGNGLDLGSGNGLDLGGDLEFETAETVGNAPNSLSAMVVGSGSTISINLQWSGPTAGKATKYQVWRAACPNQTTIAAPCSLSPSVKPVEIASAVAPGPGGGGSYPDGTTKNNIVYLYFATATIQDSAKSPSRQSGASNIVAITR